MIIFRYLSRQIFQVMTAVTLILLVVVMISRFLGYLGQAVAGEISSDILLRLMLFRLPEFLLVIIPFALFLGILLAFGRMYSENEMTVLSACGYSQKRLATATVLAASLLSVFMGVLSLQVAPLGLQNTEQLLESQDELTELDLIVAGQFQRFAEGLRTTYAESISTTPAGRLLNNTFVAWRQPGGVEGGLDRVGEVLRVGRVGSAKPETVDRARQHARPLRSVADRSWAEPATSSMMTCSSTSFILWFGGHSVAMSVEHITAGGVVSTTRMIASAVL